MQLFSPFDTIVEKTVKISWNILFWLVKTVAVTNSLLLLFTA